MDDSHWEMVTYMRRKGLFGLGKWKPDLNREPPPKNEWPTHVKALETRTFNAFIEKYPMSLIDFYSPSCKPCNAIAPQIRVFSKRYKYRIAFGKVNVLTNRELAGDYHILSVPNLIIFSYGEKVKTMIGKSLLAGINEALDDILSEFEKK